MIQQIYPQVPHTFKYELNKDMDFSAAHYIPHEDAGVCSRVHGHTYFVNLTIAGDTLDELGFLVNFSTLKKQINDAFDHRLLNDLPQVKDNIPSTEKMAEILFDFISEFLKSQSNQPTLLQVFLRETPSSYVIYRGGL